LTDVDYNSIHALPPKREDRAGWGRRMDETVDKIIYEQCKDAGWVFTFYKIFNKILRIDYVGLSYVNTWSNSQKIGR